MKSARTNQQQYGQKQESEVHVFAVRRMVRASALIIGGLGLACLLDPVVSSFDSEDVLYESTSVSLDDVLFNLSSEDQRDQLPNTFKEEVLTLNAYRDIQVSGDGMVVGFFSSKDKAELFTECVQGLKEKGWVKVESGQETMTSFVKEDGVYQWLYLSCSRIGKESVAVIQIG